MLRTLVLCKYHYRNNLHRSWNIGTHNTHKKWVLYSPQVHAWIDWALKVSYELTALSCVFSTYILSSRKETSTSVPSFWKYWNMQMFLPQLSYTHKYIVAKSNCIACRTGTSNVSWVKNQRIHVYISLAFERVGNARPLFVTIIFTDKYGIEGYTSTTHFLLCPWRHLSQKGATHRHMQTGNVRTQVKSTVTHVYMCMHAYNSIPMLFDI